MKKKRHSMIIKLITEKDIETQTQLTNALMSEGFGVTQATVSRDINELGLIKIPSELGGSKYSLANRNKNNKEHITIFSRAVTGITYALHTVVVKTYPGMAQAVAASLDNINIEEILGSIAGDDTILLITKTEQNALLVAKKLEKMFE